MREQQLFGAEHQRALACYTVNARSDGSGEALVVGQRARRAFYARAVRCMIEQRTKPAPILDQRGRRAEGASATFGFGEGFDCMALREQCIFGLN